MSLVGSKKRKFEKYMEKLLFGKEIILPGTSVSPYLYAHANINNKFISLSLRDVSSAGGDYTIMDVGIKISEKRIGGMYNDFIILERNNIIDSIING